MIMNPHDNGIIGKSQNQSQSKLQIISIMSVPPFKVTEPRRVCQVKVMSEISDDHHNINPIQGCYQTILYYENLNELEVEDHGWSLAGWIVESLSRALLEYPLLAGRLHRIIDVNGYDETAGLQIVSNDSGVRFLEAWYSMGLSDFLELMNEKEHHLEDDLVSWKEIDVHCPQFSPLCYVQVTNFDCGGYSIGISCSLLLAEIFVVENFLNKWAQIHNNMLIQNQNNVKPVFCHTNKSKYSNGSLSSYIIISCTKRKHRAQNMVFKLINYEDVSLTKESWREVAVLCIEEAEQKLDKNVGSDFSLVMKESTEVIMIECCSKSGCNMQGLDLKNQVLDATWEDLGVNEVAFQEGNKPVHMSCWIESVVHGYCVMVIPCKQQQGNAFVVIL